MNTHADAILHDKPTSVGALLNWRAEKTRTRRRSDTPTETMSGNR